MSRMFLWNPEEAAGYTDCEAATVDELPQDVPPGSCCRVEEDGSFWLLQSDYNWRDVTDLFTDNAGALQRPYPDA